MEVSAISDENNKENVPPVSKKERNPIPPIAPSFKKSSKRKLKRVPLADITNVVNNSAPLALHQQDGVSASPFVSVSLHSNSRRKTQVVADSKTLRMAFR
ncbi:hypothetical protein L6164_022418 [Bauhinia variegata]|uniref:Uncharacterized protein n=1 Tax=Bauhinia variegata TaxID=167791 RepID=A0ACB9MF56_BAUVA|nr:hypothetical protein L6164_022418 [Bauhinia variegata]